MGLGFTYGFNMYFEDLKSVGLGSVAVLSGVSIQVDYSTFAVITVGI